MLDVAEIARRFGSFAAKSGGKGSTAGMAMRPESVITVAIFTAPRLQILAWVQLPLGIARQERFDLPFIFGERERAGGIDESPAGSNQLRGGMENSRLSGRAMLNRLG